MQLGFRVVPAHFHGLALNDIPDHSRGQVKRLLLDRLESEPEPTSRARIPASSRPPAWATGTSSCGTWRPTR